MQSTIQHTSMNWLNRQWYTCSSGSMLPTLAMSMSPLRGPDVSHHELTTFFSDHFRISECSHSFTASALGSLCCYYVSHRGILYNRRILLHVGRGFILCMLLKCPPLILTRLSHITITLAHSYTLLSTSRYIPLFRRFQKQYRGRCSDLHVWGYRNFSRFHNTWYLTFAENFISMKLFLLGIFLKHYFMLFGELRMF